LELLQGVPFALLEVVEAGALIAELVEVGEAAEVRFGGIGGGL
jgi:hypothetical protein